MGDDVEAPGALVYDRDGVRIFERMGEKKEEG